MTPVIRAREDRWFDRFRRSGDPRLLAKVFDRTAPELWKVAVHLCRNRHAAEDALQGTFLTAIEAKDSWDPARPLLPWLLGMLANRVRENRRRDARTPAPERVAVAARERDPAELAEQGELEVAFRAALQRVVEPFRTALERHLVHGHAAHEIAAELGVPAGTVRMRLHRGLEQLRQKLPTGFVAGGLAIAALSPESFAAMRQAVLAAVPGGSAVAALGSGHMVLGVIGVLLMKKTSLTVAACLLLGLGTWILWPELGSSVDAATSVPPLVAMAKRPFTPPPDEVATRAADAIARVAQAAPSRTATKGRLRVVLRHGGTGEPVQLDLQVQAGLGSNDDPHAPTPGDIQFGTTDAQGVATFTLPVGLAKVSNPILLRKKPVEAEIVANAETELLITLPAQLAAAVEVVDSRGQPIAGARILGRIHSDIGYYVERELGRTGADGWWRDQFLDGSVPVRATATGYQASAQVQLHSRSPQTRLVLGDRPAAVSGTVFGDDGRPLPGALVLIQPRMPGVKGEPPLALVADTQGRYESAHVRPGAITVFAAEKLESIWFRTTRTDAVVEAGNSQQVDVRFGTGTRLVVALTGPDQRPIAGQEVHAMWLPESEVDTHIAALARSRGQTDANGVCVLESLLPGDHDVQVIGAKWHRQEKVTLVAGQEHRLEWTFAPAVDIEVQVVDAARKPLAAWQVELSPGIGTIRTGQTDPDGVARFAQVADKPYEVSVRQRPGTLESARTKVVAHRRNIVIVDTSAQPTATIRGAVQLPKGMDPAGLSVELTLVDHPGKGSLRESLTDPGATFRFADLAAGAYDLVLRRSDDGRCLALPRRIEVAAATDVDLGEIVLLGPADLRIHVACADGGKVRDLRIGAALPERPRYFGTPPCLLDASGATVQDLPAGRFELLVWGSDIAPLFLPVEVAGSPLQVSVTPQRAMPVTFQIVGLPTDVAMATLAFYREGSELLREVLRDGNPLVRGFLPGSYRIEIESMAGWRGGADFTVGNSPSSTIEVRIGK